MESEQPRLSSITLPRNFMFHYQDGQPPRTPEPDQQPEDLIPPPPPRQTLRVRRRRTVYTPAIDVDDFKAAVEDRPIPTIEPPELHSDAFVDFPSLPPTDNDYLSPGLAFGRMLSPPKTPVSQIRCIDSFDGTDTWAEMDHANHSETSSRPTSSSGFSDSSISSRGSVDSFPSLGGSCTSPEEDMNDPFSFCAADVQKSQARQLSSPLAFQQSRPKKLKLRATFTEDMDCHLWTTYLTYLQDPTVTPFKSLPSTVPPNGVCHRVARKARMTWKGPRQNGVASLRAARHYGARNDTPDTIKPFKSGSNTPVPANSKSYSRFPNEKQCRKRLRILAKQKPTLSAHYQRLLQRSPSPFQSSPQESSDTIQPAPLSSPFSQGSQGTTTFSTRDMNVSLATSTAASMQLGNPLSQLATDNTPRPAENSWSHARASAHQKSQSLHIGLGLGLGDVFGSSFQNESQSNDVNMNQNTAQTWHAPSANPPRLGSPFQLHAPKPMSRPFKRRALHNFEHQARNRGNSFVDQLFGAPAESSHRRVRSRGFSLGDMMEGSRRGPSANCVQSMPLYDPFVDSGAPAAMHTPAPTSPVEPETLGQSTIRLGSPFVGRPNNTFPRASTSHGFEPAASFEQRFAGVACDSTLSPRP
ncbi:hypothetical protein BS50DRAFT_149629 [Corynespora cassiicola Philippines]|uniref:Uncharacterized protein n=1 Tax=Corynespora cassiicola Philippines TaxID=1448308 RepID=A0A2T2N7M2_CORCC|nr:hypothetical protein BS50DRAFT_149629 [Corynespora cassiicola Philippines]